jgi:D-beta-D-heptose 7-phosphate kinase/D-beta-D-heptose 1-phosphate adenosyltransferase
MPSENDLRKILAGFVGKRVAVVGDVMIDRYYWGRVSRISPEAPVPVVEVDSEQVRFGGAANVSNNIRCLGGTPLLIGLIGDDHAGKSFAEMLRDQNMDTGGLVVDAERPTTIKTRVIAGGQHVVRVDNESKAECPEHLRQQIVDAVKYRVQQIDAILIEDYNKGVLTKDVIDELLAVAQKYNKIVTVDPKFNHFLDFRGVTLFKPNRRETEEVLGGRLKTDAEIVAAGKKLLGLLGAKNVLLTRGEQGMSLIEASGEVTHIHTVADNIQDVSGAGDTVISTLTLALASGVDVRTACRLANCAAGVVVAQVGIVPVSPEQLLHAALQCADKQVAGE